MSLQTVASSWLPGHYKVSVTYRFDDQTTTRTRELTYLYVNVLHLLVVVFILGVATLLAFNKPLRQRFMQALKTGIVAASRFILAYCQDHPKIGVSTLFRCAKSDMLMLILHEVQNSVVVGDETDIFSNKIVDQTNGRQRTRSAQHGTGARGLFASCPSGCRNI